MAYLFLTFVLNHRDLYYRGYKNNNNNNNNNNKLCGRLPQYAPDLCKLTFDLLTLKVMTESRVMWATSVTILAFLGLCSRLRPDVRQTDRRRQTRIIA